MKLTDGISFNHESCLLENMRLEVLLGCKLNSC